MPLCPQQAAGVAYTPADAPLQPQLVLPHTVEFMLNGQTQLLPASALHARCDSTGSIVHKRSRREGGASRAACNTRATIATTAALVGARGREVMMLFVGTDLGIERGLQL